MLRTERLFIVVVLTSLLFSACQPAMVLTAATKRAGDAPLSTSAPDAPRLTLIGHVAGPLVTLAVRGDIAYLGHSFELALADVANPSQPRLLASLPIPASDLALAGEIAYIGGRAGFFVVDIADPTQPRQIGALPFAEAIAGVAVDSGLAAVVEGHLLHIIDVARPARIREIAALRLANPPESVTLHAGRAYVTDHSGVQIVGLDAPGQPTLLTTIETSVAPSQVAFDGDQGYFASGGRIHRFDPTQPSEVETLNETAAAYWVRNLTVVDGLAYLSAGSAGLRIWDVRRGYTAHEIGSHQTAGLALDVAVQQSRLYVVDCDDGLLVLDAADATQPAFVGVLPILGALDKAAAAGDFLYITSGFGHRLHLLDVRNPDRAQARISHITTQSVEAFAIANQVAVILAGDRLHILDLSAPETPIVVGSLALTGVRSIFADSTKLYLGDSAGTLIVVDLTAAGAGRLATSYTLGGEVVALAVQRHFVYLHQMDVGLAVLAVDASGQLAHVAALPLLANVHKIVAVDGYLLLAAGEDGLMIVDISDPRSPMMAAQFGGFDARDVALDGDVAYVAAGRAGLRLFDMRDPLRPKLLRDYSTADCANQVIAADGRVYLVDAFGGLFIFEME